MTTPMSKPNIQSMFSWLTKNTQHFTNKVELNKASSSRNAISCDFLRIYQNDKNRDRDSFAFAFNNYKEDVQKSEITVSIMKDQMYESSKTFTIKEFETILKAFNNDLAQEPKLDYVTLVKKVRSYFQINKENNLDMESLLTTFSKVGESFNSQITDSINECEEKMQVLQDLEKEIRKKMDAYRQQLEKEMNYGQVSKAYSNAKTKQNTIFENQKTLVTSIAAKEIEKFPALKRQTFVKNLHSLIVNDTRLGYHLKATLSTYNWMSEFPKEEIRW